MSDTRSASPQSSDVFTPAQRSNVMAQVKAKNTTPELKVRRLVHALGYRYRLHRKDLPGKPDLVFAGRRKVIFVHGCFWHGHDCKRGARQPKQNADYWRTKISRTMARDQSTLERLADAGWSSLVIWECELKTLQAVQARIVAFLD